MTGFRDMSRMKKIWERTTQYFRRKDSQNLIGKTDIPTAEVIVSAPLWRRKSTLIIGGAAIVLTATALIGNAQYKQYVERNTFEFYHVYIDGQDIGTVADPAKVEELVAVKTLEMQQANPNVTMVLDTGEITYESDSAFKAVPETEATLAKLEGEFTSHAVGVELVIEGKVVGIVKDLEEADSILARVQSKFAPELAAAEKSSRSVSTLSFNGDENEEAADSAAAGNVLEEGKAGRVVTDVEFVEDVQVNELNTDPSQIQDGEELYKKIIEGSTKPTKYTVQAGDCIGCIAQKFDISQQLIYENNPWIEGERIDIGDELDLTVQMPDLTVRTTEKLVEIVQIAPPIEYVKNDKVRAGQSKTITQGAEGTQQLTYEIIKQNGYVLTEELVDKKVLKEPTATVIEKGTMVVLGEGSGKFIVPVKSYRISSKFGPRWGRNHNGVDFTGNKNIMASDAGVIEFVGNKTGLGRTIIIDHKNGFKTVYGHLNSFKVSKGDKVEKGDIIGIMGNTGNSTGTHLHFEIHKNGVVQNPLKYL